MSDPIDSSGSAADAIASADHLATAMDGLQTRSNALIVSANGFAAAMSRAFTQAASGSKQFDDVLRALALRLSSLVLTSALKPIASGITGGLNQLLGGLFSPGGDASGDLKAAMGAIKPFSAGGVIGTPTYFPLANGGLGLAGEAGPEAIVPLQRGRDGRLGIASPGGAGGNITVQIATPDLDSFRRSEAYLTGQIARAVARGQRSL
jgi:phage-related minor tail protein